MAKRNENKIEDILHGVRDTTGINLYGGSAAEFFKFLKSKYNFSDIRPITSIICNSFCLGRDGTGRKLFIKSGHHTGIYENEFLMGRALYEIDSRYFLEPLYYNDYDKYNFFANEFVTGTTLRAIIDNGTATPEMRAKMVGDIWRIFSAMRRSDVVHRDIRPENLMWIDDRLVLIDFQLAVSKTNYVELAYMARHKNRLRNLGGKKFRYRPFTWDDAYSLMKCLEFIGRDQYYGRRYDVIHHHIKSYIGTDTIQSSVRESGVGRLARHIRGRRYSSRHGINTGQV